MQQLPVRVLHIIDGLAGGGSERWVWDIIRLSDPSRVRHRVITVHPDLGRYVYAEKLRALGAYGRLRAEGSPDSSSVGRPSRSRGRSLARTAVLPPAVRSLLRAVWVGSVVAPMACARILAECVRRRPDVIHAHAFHGLLAGLEVRRWLGIPLVHSVPALFAQMADAGFGWTPRVYSRSQQLIDCFFTAYPSELQTIGVPREKIRLISGVVDVASVISRFEGRERSRAECRRALGIADDDPLLLSVGRLHPSKGHRYVIDALPAVLERNPETHWVVLGEGSERSELEPLVKEKGIQRHVHLLGFVPEGLHWYFASDLYLRTNLFEADNLSSYLAMAVGVPVVGFATGAETELLERVGHGLLVPPRDAVTLATAVSEMIELPRHVRDGIGARGFLYCREHLDIQQTISDLARVYAGYGEHECQHPTTRPA